jgi:bla regulator protein BlaR1
MMGNFLAIGLGNALAAALLAPLAALVARASRRPAWAHGAWLLVLLKLVTPPVASVPVAWPGAAVKPETVAVVALEPVEPDVGLNEGKDGPAIALSRPPEADAETIPTTARRPSLRPIPPAIPERAAWRAIDLERVVGSAWLAGIVGWSALATWRIGRFRRALRGALPAPLELMERVGVLADRLGLRALPKVVMLHGPVAPMIWALIGRPRLIVPEELWERLDDGQRDALLVHELAHLRRRDHWVRGLELIASALYWWHPALWWARRGLRQAEEQCCDAWVVWALPDAARSYASALVEAVDFLSESRPTLPIGAIGMGQARDLSRRIIMIMRVQPPRRLSMAGALIVLALAALLLPWRPTWARLPAQDKPKIHDQPPAALASAILRYDLSPVSDDEMIDRARDELELVEAKRDQKKALLDVAEAKRQGAQAEMARFTRLEKRGKGFVSAEEMEKATAGMGVADAEVALKKAELHEAEILVNQGRRRLAQLGRSRKQADKATQAKAPVAEAVRDLKYIALAVHNYISAKNHLPPPYLADKDGRPLLSWRVAILPLLEGQKPKQLYERFHLDEPWDSPHNKELLKEVPDVFAAPEGRWEGDAPGSTHYRAVVGPETVWPDPKDRAGNPIGLDNVPDGPSNTILVVEAAEAIPWTRPDDLVLPALDRAALQPPRVPSIAAPEADGFLAVYLDGSVTEVKPSINPILLRALFTRASRDLVDGQTKGSPPIPRNDRGGPGALRGPGAGPADLQRRLDALEEKLNRLLDAQGGVKR